MTCANNLFDDFSVTALPLEFANVSVVVPVAELVVRVRRTALKGKEISKYSFRSSGSLRSKILRPTQPKY
jgi:hypothetical protein